MIRSSKLTMASMMLAVATLTAGAGFISSDAHAAVPGHPEKFNGKPSPQVTNPYSPRYQHEYRHGAIPTIPVHQAMKQWEKSHATPTAFTASTDERTLSYGGGVGGVGVMLGQAKVYLVFYGNQWGGSSTDANGNLQFTNDAAGAAGAAQQMFKGIGTNGETWQNELTQWCNTSSGATSCAAGIPRTPRQSNIVAGVWYDSVVTSPAAATGTQLAQEAIRAAAHFGNTAAGSNTNAYYVIMSPKGTNPDTYQGRYCAWHDYTGDGYGVTAPGGDFAFSNQPYNIDSGAGCGVGFVNGSAGTLDGYTMTLGHEWQETMSDWFPAGGWTNHGTGAHKGQENSDECAWIAAGSAGGAANITFSTGTFAQQASWSNDTDSCAISHADVSGGGSGGGGTVLSNGVAKTGIAGATGSDQYFSLVVPAGATGLKFVTSGGTGDADLYVKFGSNPTTTVNDCKSEGSTTAESCSIATAQAGTYYVLIHGYAAFSGVSLTGSYSTGTGGGCTPSGTTLCSGSSVALPSVATGGVSSTYSLVVPAGKTSVSFNISGGTGDADLYVNFGSAPTSSTYTCRPYLTGNSETCTISSPTAGTYYANVRAYAGYSGVTLKATISP